MTSHLMSPREIDDVKKFFCGPVKSTLQKPGTNRVKY